MILDALISSFLGGGVTGIIGTIAQNVYAYKTRQLDLQAARDKYENEQKMRTLDASIQAQEWAARTQVAVITETAKADVADAKAFNTSLTSEPRRFAEGQLTTKQNWLMVLLDFIRGIIRPTLTVYLCAITTVLYVQAHRLIGGLGVTESYALMAKITDTILYLTTACVMWWFGSRMAKSKGI